MIKASRQGWKKARFPLKDVVLATITTMLGTLFGIVISQYFYNRAAVDVQKNLLNGALLELRVDVDRKMFPEYFDSLTYFKSVNPYPKLFTTGTDQLFVNMLTYRGHEKFDEFLRLVAEARATMYDFNDRIEIRNRNFQVGSILSFDLWRKTITTHNPLAYGYYHERVLPRLLRLQTFLETEYDGLVKVK